MEEITVKSPITGLVLEISVSQGEAVGPGDLLVVIESMKMENEILSEHQGTVKEINVQENQPVSEDQTILTIELS